jgi:hypothetical protein
MIKMVSKDDASERLRKEIRMDVDWMVTNGSHIEHGLGSHIPENDG